MPKFYLTPLLGNQQDDKADSKNLDFLNSK